MLYIYIIYIYRHIYYIYIIFILYIYMHYFCSVVLYCAEFDSIILYSIFLLRCFAVCYIDLNCIIAMSLLVL